MRTFRRVSFVFNAALLFLIVVLLARTALFTSRQISVAPALPIAIDQRAAAERLAGTLRFQTISHQDPSRIDPKAFLGLHDYLAQSFPAVHRTLTREVIGGYSLLYTWPGDDPSLAPIVLLGHLDVVPVEPGTEQDWTYPPFGGTIAQEYIWGRGAMDLKMAVVGTLEAVEILLQGGFNPRQTILLAFGHDEEAGGRLGATRIAAVLMERGVRPALFLDEGMAVIEGMVPGIEAPIACIGVAEKGYVSVELVAQAEGGHSSMPPRKTAAGLLASAIHAIEAYDMPTHLDGPVGKMFEYLGPEMTFSRRLALANLWLFGGMLTRQLEHTPPTRALIQTTAAVTMLEGSVKENVLPGRARAVVNIRVHPSERIDDVVERLRTAVDDSRVTITRLPGVLSEPSSEAPIDTPAFSLLQRTIAQHFPDAVVAPGLVLGATDSRHYGALSEHIYRFMPIRVTREDTLRIHGTNERLGIRDYAGAIAFYAGLIRNAGER